MTRKPEASCPDPCPTPTQGLSLQVPPSLPPARPPTGVWGLDGAECRGPPTSREMAVVLTWQVISGSLPLNLAPSPAIAFKRLLSTREKECESSPARRPTPNLGTAWIAGEQASRRQGIVNRNG